MVAESFGFIVTVAIFGIVVVFTLLVVMLIFMGGMQGADRAIGAGTKRSTAGRVHLPSVSPAGKPETADWVIAAALTYLIHEEEQARPETTSWTSGRAYREDPWLVQQIGDNR